LGGTLLRIFAGTNPRFASGAFSKYTTKQYSSAAVINSLAMLEVKALKKRYGKVVAVDDVSLRAGASETIGLLGPNGAGKTTTVSMIAGLFPPDSGEVLIDGSPLRGDTDPVKRKIGLVPQNIALYDELTALDNLIFLGALYELHGATIKRAIAEALDLVGLSDRAKDKVGTFSGGMKRRLNLAAALLHDPQILLLDEPTVGVDPQSRNAIFDNLETLKKRGKTLVYTTHYMEEAERLCDRIAVIDSGRVIATGTKDELVRDTIGTKREVIVEFADGSHVTHLIDDAAEMLRVMREAETQGSGVRDLTMKSPSLEKVFLHLTGKGLRE